MQNSTSRKANTHTPEKQYTQSSGPQNVKAEEEEHRATDVESKGENLDHCNYNGAAHFR